MKLILLRHAESTDNESRLLGGNSEAVLTEKGRKQATDVGLELASKYPDLKLAYTSPRRRCRETTEFISAQFPRPLTITPSDLLTERHFGTFSGKNLAEIDFSLLDNLASGNEYEVESLTELEARVNRFVDQILTSMNCGILLVVTHSNPSNYLIARMEHKSFTEVLQTRKLKNAEYLEYDI